MTQTCISIYYYFYTFRTVPPLSASLEFSLRYVLNTWLDVQITSLMSKSQLLPSKGLVDVKLVHIINQISELLIYILKSSFRLLPWSSYLTYFIHVAICYRLREINSCGAHNLQCKNTMINYLQSIINFCREIKLQTLMIMVVAYCSMYSRTPL